MSTDYWLRKLKQLTVDDVLVGLVYLFVVLLPLTYRGTIEVGFTIKLSEVIAILTFLLWICVRLIRREFKIKFNLLDLFIFGFLAVTALSLTQAINLERGIAWWLWLASYALAVYYLISNLVVDEKTVRGLLKTYVVVAAVMAVFGVYQFFADYMDLPFTWIRPTYSKFGSLAYPRPHATLKEPLLFGHYLLPAAIFIAVSFLCKKQLFFRSWVVEGALLFLFSVITVATLSRGAVVALAGSLGFLALGYLALRLFGSRYFQKILSPLWPRFLALLLIVGLVFPAFFGMTKVGLYLEELTKTSSEKIEDKRERAVAETSRLGLGDPRWREWRRAWKMFKENPVLGVGWGNYGAAKVGAESGIAGPPGGERGFAIVNNEVLEVAVEAGILGLIFYLGYSIVFVLTMFRALWRSFKEKACGWAPVFAGFLLSFLAMSAQFLTFSTIQIGPYWFVIGLGAAAYQLAFRKDAHHTR